MPSTLVQSSLPVFHPDHPHNRHPAQPQYTLTPISTNMLPTSQSAPTLSKIPKTPGGSSDASSSPISSKGANGKKRCFCGRDADGGLYCSIDCARLDAFSSLCFKPGSSSQINLMDSLPSTPSKSRQPSPPVHQAAYRVNPSSREEPMDGQPTTEWTGSHYRRIARADLRREERKEERRRRRAEGSSASSATTRSANSVTSSTISNASSSSGVPDLVGGSQAGGSAHGHSRNISIASSTSSSSIWSSGSAGSLSRNHSFASNTSNSKRYRVPDDMVEVIEEDIDEELEEEEYVENSIKPTGLIGGSHPYSGSQRAGHKRSKSGHHTTAGMLKKKTMASPASIGRTGIGKDMRDILEEIISMEKSFELEDEIMNSPVKIKLHHHRHKDHKSRNKLQRPPATNDIPSNGLLPPPSSSLLSRSHHQHQRQDRPPRTPSPTFESQIRKQSTSIIPPPAPLAPTRLSHKSNLSNPYESPGYLQPLPPTRSRPSSIIGLHQSSLSESHTALYLATASPSSTQKALYGSGPATGGGGINMEQDGVRGLRRQGGRSASPELQARNSISFSPDAAGPFIQNILNTPTRGRKLQTTPQQITGNYGVMNGWRFPNGHLNQTSNPIPTNVGSVSMSNQTSNTSTISATSTVVSSASTSTSSSGSSMNPPTGFSVRETLIKNPIITPKSKNQDFGFLSSFEKRHNESSVRKLNGIIPTSTTSNTSNISKGLTSAIPTSGPSSSAKSNKMLNVGNPSNRMDTNEDERLIPPHLLWPAPPLFPQSPDVETPPPAPRRPNITNVEMVKGKNIANPTINPTHALVPVSTFANGIDQRRAGGGGLNGKELPPLPSAMGMGSGGLMPPRSGMKLGVLLGSGAESSASEMDDDDDDEDDDEDESDEELEDVEMLDGMEVIDDESPVKSMNGRPGQSGPGMSNRKNSNDSVKSNKSLTATSSSSSLPNLQKISGPTTSQGQKGQNKSGQRSKVNGNIKKTEAVVKRKDKHKTRQYLPVFLQAEGFY